MEMEATTPGPAVGATAPALSARAPVSFDGYSEERDRRSDGAGVTVVQGVGAPSTSVRHVVHVLPSHLRRAAQRTLAPDNLYSPDAITFPTN
jgi:hypothetical protein